MRKLRTYEQMLKMHLWFKNRKCVQDRLRNTESLKGLLAVPTVMTEENMKAVESYERSLMGPDFRWPAEGEIYIATRDVFARSQVWLACAGSSAGEGVIPTGTRVTISASGVEKPILVGALPEDPKELEEEFVSKADRYNGQFQNYNLIIGILEFRDGFKLIGACP